MGWWKQKKCSDRGKRPQRGERELNERERRDAEREGKQWKRQDPRKLHSLFPQGKLVEGRTVCRMHVGQLQARDNVGARRPVPSASYGGVNCSSLCSIGLITNDMTPPVTRAVLHAA